MSNRVRAYFPSGHVIETTIHVCGSEVYIDIPYFGTMGRLSLREHPEIKIDFLGERNLNNTESML